MELTKDEIISKLKELAPLYKEKGFEIVCINDNEEEYTSLIIYYKIDMKAIKKYSKNEWVVTKLMEFFDEIKSHLKIEINFKSDETLKSNDKVVFLDINKKFEIARKEFDKKKDMPYLYSLTKENKDKLRELEIFKNKVPFQFKNGWFDLLYNLGRDIEEVCKLASCELPQIDEIKSKYSSLRFDYYYKSDVKVPKIVEKLIDSLIYEAEDKSERICEFCGSDGSSDITEDGDLVLKVCDRWKEAESEELNKEKSFLSSAISRKNWYSNELLENVAHIQKNAKHKNIDVDEYLGFLDKTVKLIERIKVKVDEMEFVDFNADDYTFNELHKYGNQKRFSKSFIIREYLGTMNKQDIYTLCSKFGKDRVIKELNYKFRAMFELGFIDIKGLIIAVTGDYREYGVFKEILEIVNSYDSQIQ
jgi:hypothetical protein